MFYDIGAIWNEDDQVKSIKMLNGTGIGLNAIFPFGFIGKAEWAFRLGNPVVGQLVLGLGAKF
jgi:hemolysin activation/secretion protein